MVFNWFRRQFSNQSEEAEVEQQDEVQEQSSEPEQLEEQTQADTADYLTWAKAAYQNIQKQKQPTEEDSSEFEPVAETQAAAVEETVSLPVEAETDETPEVAETVEETVPLPVEAETEETPEVAETVEETVPLPVEAETEETPEVAETVEETVPLPVEAETDETLEAVPATIEAVEVVETEPEPAAPVPAWAREDRQARLEKLKATAEETEPEPVTAAATTVEPSQPLPDIEFDEGFLWSAEVLAAQGRRPEDVSLEEISWLKRLRQGLDKTRRGLINQLKAIVGQGPLNQDAVMEIEALLLQADVGVEATDYIINTLQEKLRNEVLPPEEAIAYLKQIIRDLLDKPLQDSYNPTFVPEKDTLNIWLMTGVNGVGKTTTIGKLSHLAQKSGYRCLIAAADTFRAAAVQQVKVWGERSGTEVISNPGKNTDPAAVVFDAIAAAQSRKTELLLVDTAGRLQNKKNLMDELSKIRRIVDKKAPDAKIESLLVLDATLGQNGLRQAEVFSQAAQLSGVVLTKLDGTAKGGVALAVVQQLGLPIRFIGAGEGIEDLRPFSSYEFVEALLNG